MYIIYIYNFSPLPLSTKAGSCIGCILAPRTTENDSYNLPLQKSTRYTQAMWGREVASGKRGAWALFPGQCSPLENIEDTDG